MRFTFLDPLLIPRLNRAHSSGMWWSSRTTLAEVDSGRREEKVAEEGNEVMLSQMVVSSVQTVPL